MSETHENLEQAEKAEHAAPDPFNRKVAFTMAIIAAILAGVAMLGHRAHNDTLRHQAASGVLKVKEADAWAQYQAKRMRQHVDQKLVPLVRLLPDSGATEAMRSRALEEMGKEIANYKKQLEEVTVEANDFKHKAEEEEHEAHLSHERANWLDFAHLAVEIGLVLSSITLLTKRPTYWYIGLLSAGIGLGLAAASYTVVH